MNTCPAPPCPPPLPHARTVGRGARLLAGLAAGLAVLGATMFAEDARAASGEESTALLTASPALGTPNVPSAGLSDLVVHFEWARAGDVTFSVSNGYDSSARASVETTLRVERSATLVLPVDPSQSYGSELVVTARERGGRELGRARVTSGSHEQPLVVAMVEGQTPLLAALSGKRVDYTTQYSRDEAKTITVVHPPEQGGRTYAPEHVYGYQEATVVLASDTALAGLGPSARAALMSWVKLGGRLALIDEHKTPLGDLPHQLGKSVPYGAGHVISIMAPNEPIDAAEVVMQVRAALEAPRSGVLNGATRYESDAMRRALDPNEHFRPALGAAALLLVLYAIVVGPVLYRRARSRKKPLEVLWTIPATSAVALGLILSLGLFSKGLHGRTRRLTFVELGNGDAAGPSRIFRAFYSSHSTTIDVEPAAPGSLPRLAYAPGGASERGETLEIGSDKSALRGVTLPPWQAVLAYDEAATSLDGSVTVTDSVVSNGSSHVLRDVVVHMGSGDCRYIESIAPHTSAALSGGGVGPYCAGGTFYPWELSPVVPKERREAYVSTWSALNDMAGQSLMPKTEATLLAEVVGLRAPTSDSGLKVEDSRTFIHVTGGGAR